ncbi:hypothetical protein [Mycoplasmopsis alligatoris]|uniref:Lipoprotein n=1 Tax=Mycoplasmopsis alligatoris A21JP2 TaxID=747682 RepID=D4XWU0_9BACT|nr:hypothetical protein [Mycoplasmopsis alligatoris]EFF41163.1 hypothetical protein MALL_0337 [Mycoplasmopsis alligatoris A21JP2]
MKTNTKFKLLSLVVLGTTLPIVALSCQKKTTQPVEKDKNPKEPAGNNTTDSSNVTPPPTNTPGSTDSEPKKEVVEVKTDSNLTDKDFLPPANEVPETQTEGRALMKALLDDKENWVAAPNVLTNESVIWDAVKKLERNAFVEVKYTITNNGFKFVSDKNQDLTKEIKAAKDKPKAAGLVAYLSTDPKEATLFYDGENLYIFGKESAESKKYRVWTVSKTLTDSQKAKLLLEDFYNYAFNLDNVHHANNVNPVIYLSEIKRMWQEVLILADKKVYITNKNNNGYKEFINRTEENKFSNIDWEEIRKDAFLMVKGEKIPLWKYYPAFNNAFITKPEDRLLDYEESMKSFVRVGSYTAPSKDQKSETVGFEFALYKLVDGKPVKHFGVETFQADLVFEDPKATN